MEEEVRDVLRGAVSREEMPPGGLGMEISALFGKSGLNFDIPDLRGQAVKPARFERG